MSELIRHCTDDIRRRIAVYGGAFDPITNSHLLCAAEIIHSGAADEVWFVPCGPRPDKPALKTPPLHRYVMCQIAVNSTFGVDFPVKVSGAECFEEKSMFSYDLLCKFRGEHPDCDFTFVIGSDWLQPTTNISSWKAVNKAWKEGDPENEKIRIAGHLLLQEFSFIVIPRPGYDVERTQDDPTGLNKYGKRLSWLSMPAGMTFIEGNLSSTEIRKRFRPHEADNGAHCPVFACEGLVSAGVLGYIQRTGLYIK